MRWAIFAPSIGGPIDGMADCLETLCVTLLRESRVSGGLKEIVI